MAGLGHHLARLTALVGGRCIYKDKSHILVVKLVRIEVREAEVYFTLKPLSVPGLPATLTRTFRIGGQAGFMTFAHNHIASGLLNYLLFTQPRDVQRFIRLAADLPGTDTLLRALREAMRPSRPARARAA